MHHVQIVGLENPIVDHTLTVPSSAWDATGLHPGEHWSLSALPQAERQEKLTALKELRRTVGESRRSSPGGSALNTCRVAAWCGVKTAFVGAVGDDDSDARCHLAVASPDRSP